MQHPRQEVFFLVNPNSASGKTKAWWKAASHYFAEQDLPHQWEYSYSMEQSVQYVQDALKKGFRQIVAVGGDGTNHAVINALMNQEICSPLDILYALYPLGTGNDWARYHKIPRKTSEWLDMWKRQNVVLHDLGWVEYQEGQHRNNRYFVNVAGLAYDAYLVHRIEKENIPKDNKLVYLWMLLKCLLVYKMEEAIITSGQKNIEGEFYTINIGVTKFAGGGMEIVPEASPYDEQLSMTGAKGLSKWEVIRNIYRFYNGTYSKYKKVIKFHMQQMDVSVPNGNQEILIEADGEFLGNTPASFKSINKAFKVVLP